MTERESSYTTVNSSEVNSKNMRVTADEIVIGITAEHAELIQHLFHFLDLINNKCKNGTIAKEDIETLFNVLNRVQKGLPERYWKSVVVPKVQVHPVRTFIHEDPCTKHSYDKPKGYAGDAELISYFYNRKPSAKISDIGKHVFNIVVNHETGFSVRERASLIAREIDHLKDEVTKPRILSIACGQLFEASLSESVLLDDLDEIVGIDQDQNAVDFVNTRFEALPVRAETYSVKDLIRRPLQLGTFDFIYSSGLYDYLEEQVARKLNETIFRMLNPGGRLLVTNFMPETPARGYMETFMDWHLIYRQIRDMEAISNSIPHEEILNKSIYKSRHSNIIYLNIRKKL